MPAVSVERFERLLRSLDAEELTAFVADVWELRGRETRVEGKIVVSAGGPFDGVERLLVTPGRRVRAVPPESDVDAVVSPRSGDRRREAAADDGARFVGPDELRDVLLYAVDRRDAERLFASYFRRPLLTERPRRGVAGWFRAVASRRAAGAGLLLVMLVGVVVAGAGGGGVPFADSASGPTPGGPLTGTVEPLPDTPGAGQSPDDGTAIPAGSYPVGLSPDGVTDADEVATAHGQEVVRTTYDLLIVHEGSEDLLFTDREWAFSRQTVARFHTTHYWYRFAGLEVTENGSTREVVFDDFADGTYDYRRIAGPGEPTYVRGLIPTGGGNGLFTALGEAYIRRYLATTESEVEPVPRDDQTMFRVVATGTPTRVDRSVSDYRAVALVNWVGLVYHLSVEYTVAPADGGSSGAATGTGTSASPGDPAPGNVSFEMVYRDVYGTSVGEPPWYDGARNATNETVVDLWPADRRWWTRPIGIDYDEDR